MTKCIHGRWAYEGCDACKALFFAARQGAGRQTGEAPPAHEVMTDVHRLVDERDELKRRVEELEGQVRTLYNDGTRVATERDALKARLDQALAHMKWLEAGAPQPGEPCSHPACVLAAHGDTPHENESKEAFR